MSAIIGRIHSPANADGSRDRVYLETCLQAIIEPETGKKLTKILKDMKEPLATETTPGLMSPTDKTIVNRIHKSEIIEDETDPNRECIWLETIDTDEEL